MKEKEIKRTVKEGYARIAKQATSYYREALLQWCRYA